MIDAMCGVGVILDPASTTPRHAAAAMTAALSHRGPDGTGSCSIGPAVLLHTRLAIIDVAGGVQPLSSEDGACATVVNGEIYNHRELRAELEAKGHRFATRSDSEVIVHLYEDLGPECVRRLNGIFAFALWDNRRSELLLARDHFGVKPLYWWSDGRRLAAASEIGALLASGLVSPEVDPIALDHFLAWRFVPSPRTLFAGVSKLPPASFLVAGEDGVRVTSYREAPDPPFEDAAPAELEVELRARFEQAVERQMMSDVPYGAFLSGGIDSAAVSAAMARASGAPVKTFTIGFPGAGGELDERAAARATARALGTEHRDVAMAEFDFPAQLAACVRRLEDPCGTPSAPALLQVSRFTSEHVKVVLSGQGADEPLGGYQRHQAAASLGLARRLPRPLAALARAGAEALPRNERAKRMARLLGDTGESSPLLRVFEITTDEGRRSLVGSAGVEAATERRELVRNVLDDVEGRGVLEQALYLDTQLFLPDGLLVYGDKMSMASGLEQRVPFLDVELMRFIERIPAGLRVRGLTRKWLYRRAIEPLVPAAALRRRKHPFATPYDEWLRTSLGVEIERRFRAGSAMEELVDPEVAAELVAAHRTGRHDHKRILYCLLELSEWHRAFIEGSGEERPPVPARV